MNTNTMPQAPAKRPRWSALKRVAIATCGLVLLLLGGAVIVAFSLDGKVKLLQMYLYDKWGKKPNSWTPTAAPSDSILPDGTRVRTDLQYGTTYPNSFLDIWQPPARGQARPPTVLYLHGGGWFMGSKDMGDPLAGGAIGKPVEPVSSLVSRGFNVVNMDYALSPQYRYPTQLTQLDQVLAFLIKNGDKLGLDMTNVFIMGGSGGAHLSAQYGALLSDAAYAREVGITPAIAAEHVRGLVLFSPPLTFAGFGWRMNSMTQAYIGTKDVVNSKEALQTNILLHINERYPATYITDGNQADTFPDHAKAMVKLLRQHHVEHVLNYYESSVAHLSHTYTNDTHTPQGKENIDKAAAFIRRHTSPPF